MATLGSVSWADWVVDADAVATIDRADLPDGWPFTRWRSTLLPRGERASDAA